MTRHASHIQPIRRRIAATATAVATTAVAIAASTAFPGVAAADTPATSSDISGAALTPLANLPRSPETGALAEFCEGYRAKPASAAGRLVASRGWIVTSEARLGRHQVVTFASGFDPGTSGICFPRNANIGVFDGADLVALAYTPRSTKWTLGKVAPLESGALLVWEGQGVGAPIGELHDDDGALRLTNVASERAFCGGRAHVPNVYEKSIAQARKILIAHGWKPQRPADKPDDGDGAAGLAKHGIIEAEACSGTGVGYCAFDYRGPAGRLRVITVGGDWNDGSEDVVVSYDMSCRAK